MSDQPVKTLDYESAKVGRAPLSKLAATVFWWGWMQLFPFQTFFIDRWFDPELVTLLLGFIPPILLCALSLASIVHLRRHPELRGMNASVSAFWCGVAAMFSTAAAVLLLYRD